MTTQSSKNYGIISVMHQLQRQNYYWETLSTTIHDTEQKNGNSNGSNVKTTLNHMLQNNFKLISNMLQWDVLLQRLHSPDIIPFDYHFFC